MPTHGVNPNPRSYAQLLAFGITPAQIREAINSGLNPNQLPPEYFGLHGGYTPQSVGPGAAANIGGIDFPPATGPGSNPTYGYGNAPTGGITAGGFPGMFGGNSGSMSVGGNMSLGTLPDWAYLPSSQQYGWTSPPDYASQNMGGSMDLSGYGGQSGGFDLYGDPIDYGYLPSSNDYGWTAPDYSGSVSMPQDTSQTPGDVFGGLQDPVGTFFEPDPLADPIPVPEGFGQLTQPPQIPDMPGDFQAPTSGPMSPYDPSFPYGAGGFNAPPPDALPPGMTGLNATGVFASHGPFSTPGAGPQFSSNSFGPGWMSQYSGPAGLTQGLFTSASLGAQTGGFMPVGFGGRQEGLVGAMMQGDGSGDEGYSKIAKYASKAGISPESYQDAMDASFAAANPGPGPQYISSWNWAHGTSSRDAGSRGNHGFYYPVYSPGTGTNVPMPTTGKPGK